MRSTLGMILTPMFALSATGCNQLVVGQWTLESAEPAEAMDRYAVQSIRFNADAKTYAAHMQVDGKKLMDSGDYTFNGFTLHFQRKDGPPRKYSASLNTYTDKLKMSYRRDGEKIKAIYGKVEPPKR